MLPPAPLPINASAPHLEHAGQSCSWAPRGQWTALSFSSPRQWAALEKSLAEAVDRQADGFTAWDLRGIEALDHIGAQLLWNHWGRRWPARLELTPAQRALFEQIAACQATPAPVRSPPPDFGDALRGQLARVRGLARIGRDALVLVGQLTLDLARLARAPQRGPWRDISGHLYQMGATALPITALVGALIGVVLAYLTSNQLRNYGAETFIVNILGLSLIRELGPVLAAVLVAGRSGSAITAQIGVMRVTEELDAMRVMGISHGYRLVMPRVIALAIAMPLVSMWTTMAALTGGMLAADLSLNIAPDFFWRQLPRTVPFMNVTLALGKSVVFGVLIALIGCHYGLRVQPNTDSLGRGTTASVVTSITMVILVDALFAMLFRGMGFRF